PAQARAEAGAAWRRARGAAAEAAPAAVEAAPSGAALGALLRGLRSAALCDADDHHRLGDPASGPEGDRGLARHLRRADRALRRRVVALPDRALRLCRCRL